MGAGLAECKVQGVSGCARLAGCRGVGCRGAGCWLAGCRGCRGCWAGRVQGCRGCWAGRVRVPVPGCHPQTGAAAGHCCHLPTPPCSAGGPSPGTPPILPDPLRGDTHTETLPLNNNNLDPAPGHVRRGPAGAARLCPAGMAAGWGAWHPSGSESPPLDPSPVVGVPRAGVPGSVSPPVPAAPLSPP